MIKNRLYWMDLTKVFACFMVIVIHVSNCGGGIVNSLFGVLCHIAVPMFVLISGANFLDASRESTISNMYKRYIVPMLITFASWSFLYAVYTSWIAYHSVNIEFLKTIIINTVNGHYHMWYIWMTIGMYSIVPFLRKIYLNSSIKESIYYLNISFAYLSFRYMVQFDMFDCFESVAIDLRITMTMGFLIYFVAGKVLKDMESSKRIDAFMFLIGLCGLICNILLVLGNVQCKEGGDVYGYFSPFTIASSISAYWFLSHKITMVSENKQRCAAWFASLTFPVYMLHAFMIDCVKYILRMDQIKACLILPISMLVFLLCATISFLLSKNRITGFIFCYRKMNKG